MSYIYHNNKLLKTDGDRLRPEGVLRGNYVYAAITANGYNPVYIERHLNFAAASYNKLYDIKPSLDSVEIGKRIEKMLYYNNLPERGNLVHLYLLPPVSTTELTEPEIIITHEKTFIHKGYDLIPIRHKAVVVNYEIPFSGDRTAMSLLASDYMSNYAIKSGANIALRAGRSGTLLSSGDYPVFVAKEGVVFTPRVESGAGDSVERELMLTACKLTGIQVVEKDINISELHLYDEVAIFDYAGIHNILSIGSNFFYNTICDKLKKSLPAINNLNY